MKDLQQLTQTINKAKKLSDEELIVLRDELKAIASEAEELIKERIDPVLYERADATEERAYVVSERKVMIVERLSFSQVPLEVAKKYHGVKKVVDSAVLSPLYKKGVKIEGVTKVEYLMVK